MATATGRRELFALGGAVGGAVLAAAGRPARAAEPTVPRPARALVGFAPGGPTDTSARLYADALRGVYAPHVVVENRAGAGGRLAVEGLKASPPDGTVFLATPGSVMTLQPHVYPRQVKYDALADFVPAGTLCTFSVGLAVPANHPAGDLREFVAWLRAQSGEVTYASPAAGSGPHFIGGRLGRAVGARLTHIPYRGAAPALQDLLSGRVPMMIAVLSDLAPQHGQGLRILAVSAPQRVPRLPEVPTFAELGHPELTSEDWVGVFLPARTPPAIVSGLHAALVAASRLPEVRAGLDRLEFVPQVMEPAALAERIRAERDGWGPVVRESGFEPDQ
jgi:tripartite-type tricarboxylate transporter receptor subunit TctC